MTDQQLAPPQGLDPVMWDILRAQPPLASLDLVEMRRHAALSKQRWNDGAAVGLTVRDSCFPARSGLRGIRCLTPPEATSGAVVHIHGGGWATCDADTHLSVLAELARATNRSTLAPHASHAPEAPHPVPLEDTIDALRHVARAHPNGFHLSGDSAGANLALAALLWFRDQGETLPIRSMALYYGCFRRRFDTASHLRFGDGRYGLSTEKMRAFWDLYMDWGIDSGYGDLADASMQGLPPMQIHAAGADILLDDSRWLQAKVQAAGGQSDLIIWKGLAHGFLHYACDLPAAREASASAARFFDRFDKATP